MRPDFVVCVLAVAGVCGGAPGQAQPGAITLEQIMADPEWIQRPATGAYWSDDGSGVYFTRRRAGSELRDLFRVDLASGTTERIPDEQVWSSDVRGGDFNADRSEKVYARGGDLFVKDVAHGTVRQLTRTSAHESSPTYLVDGRIAFRRGGSIVVRDPGGGLVSELGAVRFEDPPGDDEPEASYLVEQQTRLFASVRDADERRRARTEQQRVRREADPQRLRRFYLGDGLREARRWLSPDARWMVVTATRADGDASRRDTMPRFVTDDGYVRTDAVRPKVGVPRRDPDRLFLLDLDSGGHGEVDLGALPGADDDPLAFLRADDDDAAGAETSGTSGTSGTPGTPGTPETSEPPEGDPRPVSILRVAFSDDASHLAFMARSNDNKDRWIGAVELAALALGGDAASAEGADDAGEPARVEAEIVEHLRDEAWIGWSFNEMGWLRGRDVLWFTSEASGFSQLYTWGGAGAGVERLTAGAWEVSGVVEVEGLLYFRGNRERPIEYEVYRVDPSGGAAVEQVTSFPGVVERFAASPDGSRLLLNVSSAFEPPEWYVQASIPGAEPVRLTDTVEAGFASHPWVPPAFVAIGSSHVDRPIWTRVTQVDGAWGGAPGTRPGVIFVHGAGYTQNSDNGWPYYFREQLFHSLLAHLGYVVIDMDYRASAGYGRDWRTAIYRDMGARELEDFADGIDWMVREHGVDPERVGLYGGSYGGFMALMALFKDPGRYACGAALRPVTDWAHYNDGYTANILNTPELDPEAYARSSPIEHAHGLEDPLLIIHGMVDDNVVYQDTVRLAQRLIELGKENWEVAAYPVEPHAFVRSSSWLDAYRRILELFETHLRRPALQKAGVDHGE